MVEWDKLVDGFEMIAIAIDGVPMLSFMRDGDFLLLNLSLYDSSGRKIVSIDKNELVYYPEQWDIIFVANEISFLSAPGDVLLEMRFEPPNVVSITKGRFAFAGLEVMIYKGMLCYVNGGAIMSNCISRNSNGLSVGARAIGAFHWNEINRNTADRSLALENFDKCFKQFGL